MLKAKRDKNECDKESIFDGIKVPAGSKRNEIKSIVRWLMIHEKMPTLIGNGVSNLSNAHLKTMNGSYQLSHK